MNKQWYWAAAGRKHGPCSRAELIAAARSGELSPGDYIWHPDFGAVWKKAGEFEELFRPREPEPAPEPVAPPVPQEAVEAEPRAFFPKSSGTLAAAFDALGRTFSVFVRHASWRRWLGIGFCAWICSITGFGVLFSGVSEELGEIRAILLKNVFSSQNIKAASEKMIELAAGKTVAFVEGGFGMAGESVFSSLVMLGLMLWACWLRSRGDLMLLQRWYDPDATMRDGWMLPREPSTVMFHWRIASMAVGLLLLAVCAILPYLELVKPYVENGFALPERTEPDGIWLMISLWLFCAVAFVSLVLFALTDYFMAPILYRHPELGIGGVWKRIGLFVLRNPFGMIRFFVVLWGLNFLFSILATGFLMCTMGFGYYLFALPYVGSVIVSPALYCIRGFAALWLGRCGDNLAERE